MNQEFFPGKRTAGIAIGLTLTLFALAHGNPNSVVQTQLLSFGSNANGKTGLGTTEGNTLVATPIDKINLTDRTFLDVAAGSEHSLLLSNDGAVFSFGDNGYGRTGLGTTSGKTLVATPINTDNFSAVQRITQISAGSWHSLLLSDDGKVFSFGDSSFGQTGLGVSAGNIVLATPIDTTNLNGREIIQVSAGSSHNLLLADNGTVFSFGDNSTGRTGVGTLNGETLIATPIDATNLGERRITQVSSGWEHSLLLADDGTVFSFGWNGRGQTGLNTTSGSTLIATPIDATNLNNRRITQIAAGAYHSLLLADDGTVFCFGWNIEGQAGLGTTESIKAVATQIDSTNLAGRTIIQVDGGLGHSLLLADDGSVFSFGANGNGQTGLGITSGKTLIATPIDMTLFTNRRVTDLSADAFHSLILTVPEPNGIVLFLFTALLLQIARPGKKRSN